MPQDAKHPRTLAAILNEPALLSSCESLAGQAAVTRAQGHMKKQLEDFEKRFNTKGQEQPAAHVADQELSTKGEQDLLGVGAAHGPTDTDAQ